MDNECWRVLRIESHNAMDAIFRIAPVKLFFSFQFQLQFSKSLIFL
jgi:hypothetical protein